MDRCLLSIDWDYFIHTQIENRGSYLENNRNIIDLWYKRYIQSRAQGKDIQKSFKLSLEVDTFWNNIKKHFKFVKDLKAFVSDSHALSYEIAVNNGCNKVFLFDSHSDLGYGGLSSLNFEVNCANWLGKLLKNEKIEEANIIYSPFTAERPEYFKPMNSIYNIRYPSLDGLGTGIEVAAIHICRSGAWTPPWFDKRFLQFIDELEIPCKISDCPPRKWDTGDISFSDAIYYIMA